MTDTLYYKLAHAAWLDRGIRKWTGTPEFDLKEKQKEIFESYKFNKAIINAICETRTIENRFAELSKVGSSFPKILLSKNNEEHNERLKELAQLIAVPNNLYFRRIFSNERLLTETIEYTPNMVDSPLEQAKYLDEKIREFYIKK